MDTQKYMTDRKGSLVPIEKVRDQDKLENDLVGDLFEKAQVISNDLAAFKGQAMSDVDTFIELLAERYNTSKGGKRGNVTLTSFDGLKKVSISIADFIDFGAELNIAKDLIDECIINWSGNSNDEISTLVKHAFRVDKNKRVNTQAILGLRKLKIEDPKWKKAMEAISDSVRIASSKSYIRFYNREDQDAEWKAISLDIAKCEVSK